MSKLERTAYAAAYGPTIGDKVRLGDTDLFAQVEEDLTHPGEEALVGLGKTVRDGMGQCQCQADEVVDLVIANALLIDFWGVIKADIAIKNGRIAAIGKAGNPDTQAGVDIRIGPGTEVIGAQGLILTAGAIDAHVNFICPQQAEQALMAGITTLLGGGTGAALGGNATACTPGPWNIRRMLQAAESLPVNLGVLSKGSGSLPNALEEQVRCGAMGMTLHEDWGATPTAIDCALAIAEKMDVQLALHADTCNEFGFVADSIAAFKDRCVLTYQAAGAGAAPDMVQAAGLAHVLPASTDPALPYTINTVDEHLDMLLARHGLSPDSPEDLAFARKRLRSEAIAAEDMLHDLGALAIVASNGQSMGHSGEIVTRTWQMAHTMKAQRGHLPPPPYASATDRADNDNYRIKRYISKYTINPALAHGIAHEVGSTEVGKLADLVLWQPAFFGIRPSLIIKGGMVAAGPMGDPGASRASVQPVRYRPLFGAVGGALGATCMTFVSQWAFQAGEPQRLDLKRRIGVARDVRQVRKIDLIHNCWQPRIEVDPRTYAIRADGQLLTCEPARSLPLAQRYALF